jgi:hypothetical protein
MSEHYRFKARPVLPVRGRMRRHSLSLLAALCCTFFGAIAAADAATSTNIVVTPTSPVFDENNVAGVSFDAAPGFPSGSFASDGAGKTDMQFAPEALFLRPVTLGEIARMSYWTKKGTTHSADPADWYLNIYTKPYAGDISTATWYGDRIGTEPYFASGLNDPAGQWNQWTTDGTSNRLRFFESTAGYFGSYTDPDWATFVAGNALSGQPYAGHEVLYFSVQTGSAWANGFTGKVDGVRIELTDGSVATINFENPTLPANKDACKKNGWQSLTRGDGSTFTNQGDCIQYINTGK